MEAWKDELYHHGIEGMKWGVRRYQNPDGSLTEEGKKRYYKKIQSTKERYSKATMQDKVKELQFKNYENFAILGVNTIRSVNKMVRDRSFDNTETLNNTVSAATEILYNKKKIDRYKQYIEKSNILYERLDLIDSDSLGYKRATKEIKKIEHKWVDDVVAGLV